MKKLLTGFILILISQKPLYGIYVGLFHSPAWQGWAGFCAAQQKPSARKRGALQLCKQIIKHNTDQVHLQQHHVDDVWPEMAIQRFFGY